MRIDRALNLVTTIERGEVYPVYVYVTPFPYEVIESFHEVLGTVFTKFYQQVGDLGSVRTAAMMLRKAEKEYFPGMTGPGLSDEIARLTQVAIMKDGAWVKRPLESALKANEITADEWRDVEGEVAFFIVSSALQKRQLLQPLTGKILAAYGALLTPSSFTEFLGSLETSSKVKDAPTSDPVSSQKGVHIPS